MILDLWQIAMGLFVTTTGMACLYTLLSSLILYTGLKTIKGNELKMIASTLMYAMIIGFLYASWQFLIMFNIFNPSETLKSFVSNGLLISILFIIIFLSFSIRQIGQAQSSKKEYARKLGKIGREKSRGLLGLFKS